VNISTNPLVPLIVALIIIYLMPFNAAGIPTYVTIGPGGGNVPPTINDVAFDVNIGGSGNCIGDILSIDVSVTASDTNGVNDINDVFVTLYKKKPSTGELVWINEAHLPLFTNVNANTATYKDTLMYQGKLPGEYVLIVQVRDELGASASKQIDDVYYKMVLGDFSGDGCVDAFDITYLARHIVGTTGYEDIYSAEVTGDGGLDVADIYYLGQAIVGNPGYPLE
jgi:hypothetical protein